MCKYCTENGPRLPLTTFNNNELSINKSNELFILTHIADCRRWFYRKIDYCPICGRKLS